MTPTAPTHRRGSVLRGAQRVRSAQSLRRLSPRRIGTAIVVLASPVVLAPPLAAQVPTTVEPALDQQIDDGQSIGDGRAVLDEGHVDMGPAFVDGTWRLMIHDDTTEPSVWRYPTEVVLQVHDDALVEVPADPAYSFLGAEPGQRVHVVPQTQKPAVVWMGWNTQHPEVMARIDRGVTLTLRQVEGPGQVSVYLQSGTFGDPEVLWSSANPDPQPFWVDVNTHTHANWVFTEPGVYLVRIQASADMLDGTEESTVEDIRFVVGDATDVEAGFSTEPVVALDADVDAPSNDGATDAETGDAEAGSDVSGSGVPVALVVAAVVVIGAGAAIGAGLLRSRRVRAEADRQSGAADDAASGR